MLNKEIETAVVLARKAGAEIMKFYEAGVAAEAENRRG